jgi:DNA polymerase-3 subunit epsilon
VFSTLPRFVILDLETTGATPSYHRITEIALIRFEYGVETERWQTLVNPGVNIPGFISRLTGITNDMVQDAPTFEDIASILYDYLDGAVLAAHNVRFDYGFLKSEYRRLGAVLRQKVMCTVKLSRALYPHHEGHGLDAIMARHGLACSARHRAMGDVELVVDYVKLAKRELGEATVRDAIAGLIHGPSLPVGLDAGFLDEIPEAPGVYLFYGQNDLPLYIGKSVALRSRVLSHFTSSHASGRDMQISQEITRVEWIETAGELGALLLEARLIKERQPAHNRRLRAARTLFSLSLAAGLNQFPLVRVVDEEEIEPEVFAHLFGLFRSKRGAMHTLREIIKEQRLCPRVVGIESGKGACFSSQLQQCDGVCAGREKPELHYLRLKLALMPYRLKPWPYPGKIGVRKQHAETGRVQLHIFEDWCHLETVEDENGLQDVLASRCHVDFDLDIYKLLQRHFKNCGDVIVYDGNDLGRRERRELSLQAAGLSRRA